MPYSVALLTKIALNTGCPRFWLEDCVQEMRVNEWLRPQKRFKYTAIEFVRKYGPMSRGGVDRSYVYLSQVEE